MRPRAVDAPGLLQHGSGSLGHGARSRSALGEAIPSSRSARCSAAGMPPATAPAAAAAPAPLERLPTDAPTHGLAPGLSGVVAAGAAAAPAPVPAPALVSVDPTFLDLFQACHHIMAGQMGVASGGGSASEWFRQASGGEAAADGVSSTLFSSQPNLKAPQHAPTVPPTPRLTQPNTPGTAVATPAMGAAGFPAIPSALATASASVPPQRTSRQAHASLRLAALARQTTAMPFASATRVRHREHPVSGQPGACLPKAPGGLPVAPHVWPLVPAGAGEASRVVGGGAVGVAHARSGQHSVSMPQQPALPLLLHMRSTRTFLGSRASVHRGVAKQQQQGTPQGQGKQGNLVQDLLSTWHECPTGEHGMGQGSSMWASLLMSTKDIDLRPQE